MNTMNMPGFSAEVALNSTKQSYLLAMRKSSVSNYQSVVPQLPPVMGCDFSGDGGGICWMCWESSNQSICVVG